MTNDNLVKRIQLAIEEGDQEQAREAAESFLEVGGSPVVAVEHGLRKGLRVVGEKFNRLEVFLPEMMQAADAAGVVMSVLEPAMFDSGETADSTGTVVLGTAKGDIHTIGKNILSMLLKLDGFEVLDLGEDVPATVFVEQARKNEADIIAVSALMTSTMPGQRDVIALLEDTGERDRFAVIVGGAPTTQEWANEIGADGYAETAAEAVKMCRGLMGK